MRGNKKRSAEDKSRKAPCLTIIQKRRVKHARCQDTDFQNFILCGPKTEGDSGDPTSPRSQPGQNLLFYPDCLYIAFIPLNHYRSGNRSAMIWQMRTGHIDWANSDDYVARTTRTAEESIHPHSAPCVVAFSFSEAGAGTSVPPPSCRCRTSACSYVRTTGLPKAQVRRNRIPPSGLRQTNDSQRGLPVSWPARQSW